MQHCDYFDYWGKGTEVTVSTEPVVSPTVYPVVQCQPSPGATMIIGCLARDFFPRSLTYKWTDDNGTTLTSVQYPPVDKNNKYIGVSSLEVSTSDWTSRKPFTCSINHSGSSSSVTLQKPIPPHVTLVSAPSEDTQALMCMIEDGRGGTLQSFKWKKNDAELATDGYIQSPIKKIGELNSAVSVLKVKNTDWDSKAVYTCEVTYEQSKYIKKVSKAPITMTLNQPSPKEIFNNNQIVLECVITGQEQALVDKMKITWKIDEKDVTGTTGVAKPEGSQHSRTSTLTHSRTEWEKVKKVSCSAVREDMTPIVQELVVNKGDGSEPKVTVHILPQENVKDSAEVTLVCLVSSPVLQDYYIAWSEEEGNENGNYVDGINLPTKKTKNQYLVTSVYTTTREKWNNNKMFNCNVWPAGRNEAMKPHGVSKAMAVPTVCDMSCIEDNNEEDEFSSLWSTASSFIFLFIFSLFYSMIFSLAKMKKS